MKTIKEVIRVSEINESVINEAVMEKHIRKFLEQINKNDGGMKRAFGGMVLPLDKIDSGKIKEYNFIEDDVLKKIKEICSNNTGDIVFGLINGFICAVAVGAHLYFFKTEPGQAWYDMEKKNPLYKYKEKNHKKYHQMFALCDEIWIAKTSGNKAFDVHKLHNERSEAQKGVWDNTPEFYANWLKENLKRYKVKIENMRIEKGDDFKQIYNDIQKYVEDVMKLLFEFNANLSVYDEEYSIKNNVFQANSNAKALLGDLQDLISTTVDLDKSSKRNEYWSNPSYYAGVRREKINKLKLKIKEFRVFFDDTKKELEDFKKEHNL